MGKAEKSDKAKKKRKKGSGMAIASPPDPARYAQHPAEQHQVGAPETPVDSSGLPPKVLRRVQKSVDRARKAALRLAQVTEELDKVVRDLSSTNR